MKNNFLKYSLPDLHRLLISQELTFDYMISEFEEAIGNYESCTQAWVNFNPGALREQLSSRAFDIAHKLPHSILAGIPFGIKDIFNTRDYPTEMGSPTWKGFTPGNNARVVDSLVLEGALPAGKTSTAEFAVHELNDTTNPHDLTRTPGTSSSGSAAAVATGMVPYALGTQTAGSIIRPASFCGVWGMKPSFGLIPRTGILKTSDSLDTVGFLASHGASLRPILDAIRVKGPDYPFAYENIDRKKHAFGEQKRKWKVGFVRTHTWDKSQSYVKEKFLAFVDCLAREQDFSVTEMDWNSTVSQAHEVHEIIYNKSLSYYFQNEAKSGEHVSDIMRRMIEKGKDISPDQYRHALKYQELIAREIDRLLGAFDIVFSIGTSSDAPLRGVPEIPDPSLIWTLSHIPSIAIPLFRSPDELPFGIQMISKRWNDYIALDFIDELLRRGLVPEGSQELKRTTSKPSASKIH